MIDFDTFIERIREATLMSWELSITGNQYTSWRDRINRILNDLQNQIDAEWQESIDNE
jgi:hypothetical protein